MIPLYDNRGRQLSNPDGTLRWVKTKADDELRHCTHINITYCGYEYPVWKFIEMYCPIQTKSGKRLAFRFNDAQIETYKLWDLQMAELGYIRCNEGKGRQMGSSTLISALYYTLCITNPGYRVAILADTQEKGKGLLRKYKFFWENTPKELKDALKCVTDNATDLEFDFGSGVIGGIKVIVANENAGASYTFQAIHASEVALWENISATLMALEQTVGDEPYTCIIRETTARGPNEWKKYYETGKNNCSEFKSIFLAWYLIRSYRKPYDGHELNEYERFLRDEVHLDLDQIQWWLNKFHKSGDSLAYMKQEYPSTEAEMWSSTVNCKFDIDLITKRKEETENKWLMRGHFEGKIEIDPSSEDDDPLNAPLVLNNLRFIKDPFGAVKVFEQPKVGHPYLITCDPSEQGEDFFAVHVWDNSNGRQVAVYHQKKVNSDEAVLQSAALGFYYGVPEISFGDTFDESSLENRVYFASERQGGGVTVNRQMKRFGFNVPFDQSEDESGRVIERYGWRTTPSNRGSALDEFAIDFKLSEGRIINDYDTLCEMETFGYVNTKWQAIGDNHDDLVMSASGRYIVKNRCEANVVAQPKAKKGIHVFNPFAVKDEKSGGLFQEW